VPSTEYFLRYIARNPHCFFRYLADHLPINFANLILQEMIVLHKKLNRPLRILDLGAGSGNYWATNDIRDFLIKTNSSVTLMDASSEFDLDTESPPNLKRILGIIPQSLTDIQEDSFDFVLALDLIEHLSKEEGYTLLYEMDRISSFTTSLMTPNGFSWQPPSLNNKYNAHISKWTQSELKQLGWRKSRGQIGLKEFYGPYGLARYQGKISLILEMIAILKILSFFFPRISFSFFASKYRKNYRIPLQS
jgi:hypothetical protein